MKSGFKSSIVAADLWSINSKQLHSHRRRRGHGASHVVQPATNHDSATLLNEKVCTGEMDNFQNLLRNKF